MALCKSTAGIQGAAPSGSKRARLGGLLISLVMALFVVSAVEKLADIRRFEDSLMQWRLVGTGFALPAALGVVCAQLGVAIIWWSKARRHLAVVGAGAALVVFTGAAAYAAGTATLPQCNCIRLIDRYFQTQDQLKYTFIRNAILFGMLILGALLMRLTSPSGAGGSSARGQRRTASAFTLIETLLVVAIIGVIVSLVAPSLGRVRVAAGTAVDLSNLRSHAAIFQVYSNEWRDCFPFFTDPRATRTVIRPSRGGAVDVPFFGAFAVWNYALADGYYGGDPNHASFYTPRRVKEGPTSYYYGCVFIAAPQYWNLRTRTGLSQLVPTCQHQVSTPAIKAIFVYLDDRPSAGSSSVGAGLPDPQSAILLGLADGSARQIRRGAILSGVETGDGGVPGRLHSGDAPPVLHTLDGVAGRDIQ